MPDQKRVRIRPKYSTWPPLKEGATFQERVDHCQGWMGYAFTEHKEALFDAGKGLRENDQALLREALEDAYDSMREWHEACWIGSYLLGFLKDSFFTASHQIPETPTLGSKSA